MIYVGNNIQANIAWMLSEANREINKRKANMILTLLSNPLFKYAAVFLVILTALFSSYKYLQHEWQESIEEKVKEKEAVIQTLQDTNNQLKLANEQQRLTQEINDKVSQKAIDDKLENTKESEALKEQNKQELLAIEEKHSEQIEALKQELKKAKEEISKEDIKAANLLKAYENLEHKKQLEAQETSMRQIQYLWRIYEQNKSKE